MENIPELLTLEMYKLEKTFDGDISLGDESGTYGQAKPKRGSKPESKDPLDEIIERINERYKGEFTEADRVVIGALANKLRSDPKNLCRKHLPAGVQHCCAGQLYGIAGNILVLV